MNYRITIALAVVALLLGGAVFALDIKPPTPTPETKSTPIFSFLSVDVSEISATSQGKATVATRSEDGQWTLQKPEAAPADRVRLDSLVARLSALTATRTIDNAALAEFGLATPRAELHVKTRPGQEYVLLVGDDTPDKSSTYAKLPDSTSVYVLGAAVGGDVVRLVTEPPKATPTPTVIVPNLTPLPTAAAKPTGGAAEASPTGIVPQFLPATPVPRGPADESAGHASPEALALAARVSGATPWAALRRWRPDWLMLAVAAVILIADQASKAAIVAAFASRPPGAVIEVLGPNLRLLYTTNTGAAFGLFTNLTPVLAAISLASVPILLYVRTRLPSSYTTVAVRCTLGLLLGGALGNFVDRAGQGYVVDFIDMGIGGLRWFPYNISDASFVVGVAILAVYMLFVPDEPPAA